MQQEPLVSDDGRWVWDGHEWKPRHQPAEPASPPVNNVHVVPTPPGQLVTHHKTGYVAVEGHEVVVGENRRVTRIPIDDAKVQKFLGTWQISQVSRAFPRIHTINTPDNQEALVALGKQVGDIQRSKMAAKREQAAQRLQAARSAHRGPDIQVRTYKDAKAYERDAARMDRMGWMPQGQVSGRGKMALGTIAARWALTAGIGPMIGGASRKGEKITVTWVRKESSESPAPPPQAPTASIADELAKLVALRDQGVLTIEEFEAQKARLLGGR